MKREAVRSARQIVLGDTVDAARTTELAAMSDVDRAHLVMLSDAHIVNADRARALLQEIDGLRACEFAPLRGRPCPRGLYMAYESYLIERLGVETAGVLQTARSRNDLNATTTVIVLRAPYRRLLREALRLQATLLARARRFADVVMPAYTHYQAAVPITFGHYLAGVASALDRDVEALAAVAAGLQRCPLGAGAVGGTSLPIDPARTAALLGFDRPVDHSIDAVASRDVVLRLLAASGILGVLLSRLVTDLLLWSSREFDFIDLPDDLVGGSSMMPQKRNAFLLEHVQGRSAAPLGALVGAATAMHGTPFTNSIGVGHEAVSFVWPAIERITESLIISRSVVARLRPRRPAMLDRATAGWTGATELANRLVHLGCMSFRSAHEAVGASTRAAIARGGTLEDVAREVAGSESSAYARLDPASIARASIYGGGSGATAAVIATLHQRWIAQMRRQAEQALMWRRASRTLDDAVQRLCAADTVSAPA